MDDGCIAHGRLQRNVEKVTNMHHYWVNLFYSFIDLQLQELNKLLMKCQLSYLSVLHVSAQWILF